jgi:hypothetical protein
MDGGQPLTGTKRATIVGQLFFEAFFTFAQRAF